MVVMLRNRAFIFRSEQCIFFPQKKHYPLLVWSVSLSFMLTLRNHALLSFQACEALGLEEDGGPQQVEIFILGIEKEEVAVEEEEEGSELFLNNKASDLRCVAVSCLKG